MSHNLTENGAQCAGAGRGWGGSNDVRRWFGWSGGGASRVTGQIGSRKRDEAPFPIRRRRDHTAASRHGDEFIQDAVQADNGGGFAFVEVTENGLADIGAKFLPSVAFRDNRAAKSAGGETTVGVILGYLPTHCPSTTYPEGQWKNESFNEIVSKNLLTNMNILLYYSSSEYGRKG